MTQVVGCTISSVTPQILSQILLFVDDAALAKVSRAFRLATQGAMGHVSREISGTRPAMVERGVGEDRTPIEELFTRTWERFEQVDFPEAVTLCRRIRSACLAERNHEVREQRLGNLLSCIQQCEVAIRTQSKIADPTHDQLELADSSDAESEEAIPEFLAKIIAPESLARRFNWLKSSVPLDLQPTAGEFLGGLRGFQSFLVMDKDPLPTTVRIESFSSRSFLEIETHLVRFFDENAEIEQERFLETANAAWDAIHGNRFWWEQGLRLAQVVGLEENSWLTFFFRCYFVLSQLWNAIISFFCGLFRS